MLKKLLKIGAAVGTGYMLFELGAVFGTGTGVACAELTHRYFPEEDIFNCLDEMANKKDSSLIKRYKFYIISDFGKFVMKKHEGEYYANKEL